MTSQLALELDQPKGRTDPAVGARQWVANNPEAYGRIVAWALRDMAEGNRCSMHLYLALLRRYHWVQRGGSPYRCDNRFSSPLVDILLADHPELSQSFERRGR